MIEGDTVHGETETGGSWFELFVYTAGRVPSMFGFLELFLLQILLRKRNKIFLSFFSLDLENELYFMKRAILHERFG